MKSHIKIAFLAAAMTGSFAFAAHAVDLDQVKPHMGVKGSDGGHVGTVDKVEGDMMTLTKDDPAADGKHHRLPMTAVGSVAENAIVLKTSAEKAHAAWTVVDEPQGDSKK